MDKINLGSKLLHEVMFMKESVLKKMDHILEAIEFGDLFRLNLKNQIENFKNLEEEEEEEFVMNKEENHKENINVLMTFALFLLL